MTTFYICRHGETENNKRHYLSGWIDTPLTAAGEANALVAARKLRLVTFDKVISSDLGRAFITAYIIVKELGLTADIERLKELREVNYGELGNQPVNGEDSTYPKLSPEENTNYIPPGGESLDQMQRRVMVCLTNLAQDNPDQSMLLVAHDGTINAIYANFTSQDIGIVDANGENAHDFVARFTLDGGGKVSSYDEVTGN